MGQREAIKDSMITTFASACSHIDVKDFRKYNAKLDSI